MRNLIPSTVSQDESVVERVKEEVSNQGDDDAGKSGEQMCKPDALLWHLVWQLTKQRELRYNDQDSV